MEYIPICRGTETAHTATEWHKRENHAQPGDQWEIVPRSEVPVEHIERQIALADRKVRIAQYGYDPESPPVPFAVITRGTDRTDL